MRTIVLVLFVGLPCLEEQRGEGEDGGQQRAGAVCVGEKRVGSFFPCVKMFLFCFVCFCWMRVVGKGRKGKEQREQQEGAEKGQAERGRGASEGREMEHREPAETV